MADINKSFAVDENGLLIDNDALDIETLLVNGIADPTIVGYDAPIGSLYLRTNGTLYIKTAAGLTNWTAAAASAMTLPNILAFCARHG
jgi:hypothetical protein